MSHDRRHTSLVEQKDALSVYFDALLREEAQVETDWPVTELAEETVRPLLVPPVIAPVQLSEVQETVTPLATDGPPPWAENEFQALLFKVGGLTLAVPLIELSGIQEWEKEKVTPMPGHVSWYLGLMQYRGRTVPVIDTAELVLPPDKLERLQLAPAERIQRVVFIDDGRWGLACDEVAEVITLEPEQVRWRSDRTKRRWLAGTVIEHMCAIIDPPAFATMLANGMEDVPVESDD
jgi:purine-binding chemotaxis protein CheW